MGAPNMQGMVMRPEQGEGMGRAEMRNALGKLGYDLQGPDVIGAHTEYPVAGGRIRYDKDKGLLSVDMRSGVNKFDTISLKPDPTGIFQARENISLYEKNNIPHKIIIDESSIAEMRRIADSHLTLAKYLEAQVK